jgi:ABC-2 type transport system permease protein
MNIVLHIARREWTDLRRDGRLFAAAILVLLLLLAAFGAGVKQHRVRAAEREAARTASRTQWLEQAAKNPHDAAHFGLYVVKPSSAFSSIEPGVESYTGTAILLEAHKRQEAAFRPARDTSAVARFGEMTASAVLQFLIPLLLLLFTFPVFAEERERGTLRQTLSLGVSPRALALGKALGVLAALGVFLVPAALMGTAALVLSGDRASTAATGDAPGRLLILTVAYLLYFGVFVALGLAVSARSRTAQTALIVLLAFWLVSSVVLPRAASAWARQQIPLPTEREFADRIQRDKEEHARATGGGGRARMDTLQGRLLKQYNVSRLEDLPVNWLGIGLQEGEEEGNLLLDRNYAWLWGRITRQNEMVERTAIASPLLAMRSFSLGIAGTDWYGYQHFADAAETYRRGFVKALNNDLAYRSRSGDRSYRADRAVWESIPEFRYVPPTLATALDNQRRSLTMLTLWFGAASLLAFGSVGRMRAV